MATTIPGVGQSYANTPKANGFAGLTLDLPGAGFDPAAFAAERSPIAGVTQEERTLALVKEAASFSDGKVILVGHSAGGMTISAVAEQVPNLLLAVVYLAGFMVPNGMPLLAMLQRSPNSRMRRCNFIATNRTPAP